MLSRTMNWAKKRLKLILAVFIFLIIAMFVYNSYIIRKRYEEQTVMAQEYLVAGDFEEALEAFEIALSMNYGDRELISIGMAESYAGIHNYDKALEVLRSRYEIKKTLAVKEKIEEITAKKADYSFHQLISFGDTYFSNGEYGKAIDEYEKAKLIKSRVDISYLKIIESYMAMENYDLAREEVQDGIALAESEKLNDMMDKVELRIIDTSYNDMILNASEYIYQENYEEAFNRFNDAIRLIPERDTAYNQMAELYITLKDYDLAKGLLQNYLRSNISDDSLEILNKANELIQQRIEKERILNELYTALSIVDVKTTKSIMKDSFFIDIIAESAPFYYSPSGNMNLAMGYGMLIYDRNNIYAGGFKDRMKEGIGIQFELKDTQKDQGWYYYQGEWNHDMPNRMGKTAEEVLEKGENGKWQRKITETSGMFQYGLENGGMDKIIYINDKEVGRVYYTSADGIPKIYVDENGQSVEANKPNHYVIGQIYLNKEPTGEYYSVKNGTKYRVKLNNK